MNRAHFLSGEEGVPVITGQINSLDREKEAEQKQNRWRGVSEKNHFSPGTPWNEVKRKAMEIRARYILRTSVGSYYLKCFPAQNNQQDIHIPTSGELWDQIVPCQDPEGKSRIWIIDYLD